MRNLILVAGSGRSGTSVMAQSLGALGFHVPQPEVVADETNPKGFGEPRWVVDFHGRLLNDASVRIADADPGARDRIAAVCADEAVQAELREWISEQFDGHDWVVVKDPRLLWFLPLWVAAGEGLEANIGIISMLRHPAEVVRSKLTWYAHVRESEASALAGWINSMLDAEVGTRHLRRCYVSFQDLLENWTIEVDRISDALEMPELREAAVRHRDRVEAFYDRSLHRSKADWHDLTVPHDLASIGAAVWDALGALADGPADAAVLERLAEQRATYDVLYHQYEEITRSSGEVKRLRGKLQAARAREGDLRDRVSGLQRALDEASRRTVTARMVSGLRRTGLMRLVPAKTRAALRRGR